MSTTTPREAISWRVAGLGAFLVVLGTFLGSLLIALWPVIETMRQAADAGSNATTTEITISWLGGSFSSSPEGALLLIVIVFGALGAFIHTVTSFADYVGNQRFEASWMWWYVLRPFIGTALALVFYVAIRGGFFAQEAQTIDVNPFGIAALAGLAGLFSKQATDKLREVFDTLFRTGVGHGDAQRRDSLTNPLPMLDRVEPETDGQLPRIKITGSGFVTGSMVLVDNKPLRPLSTSSTELRVELDEELRGSAQRVEVRVRNPEPGGGTSDPASVDLS